MPVNHSKYINSAVDSLSLSIIQEKLNGGFCPTKAKYFYLPLISLGELMSLTPFH